MVHKVGETAAFSRLCSLVKKFIGDNYATKDDLTSYQYVDARTAVKHYTMTAKDDVVIIENGMTTSSSSVHLFPSFTFRDYGKVISIYVINNGATTTDIYNGSDVVATSTNSSVYYSFAWVNSGWRLTEAKMLPNPDDTADELVNGLRVLNIATADVDSYVSSGVLTLDKVYDVVYVDKSVHISKIIMPGVTDGHTLKISGDNIYIEPNTSGDEGGINRFYNNSGAHFDYSFGREVYEEVMYWKGSNPVGRWMTRRY